MLSLLPDLPLIHITSYLCINDITCCRRICKRITNTIDAHPEAWGLPSSPYAIIMSILTSYHISNPCLLAILNRVAIQQIEALMRKHCGELTSINLDNIEFKLQEIKDTSKYESIIHLRARRRVKHN